jgi:endonuclease-3
MSSSNRAAKITKTFKVLKKHFKPVQPPEDRSLLEHVLYACCLENTRHEVADEAFAKLQESYFDWNEIRVTTVAELAEVMSVLPDPAASAGRLKQALQAIFETHYAFDIEFLKKMNLGKAIQELEKYEKLTNFTVAYATQSGLSGHSIPASSGSLHALYAVGVITATEKDQGRVPGLERAIPKSKGTEFGSLLHQLGADYYAGPFSNRVRAILVEIDPEAKDRLPKRAAKKEPAAEKPSAKKSAKSKAAKTSAAPKKKAVAKKKVAKAKKKPAAAAKKSATKKKSAGRKTSSKALTKRKPR